MSQPYYSQSLRWQCTVFLQGTAFAITVPFQYSELSSRMLTSDGEGTQMDTDRKPGDSVHSPPCWQCPLLAGVSVVSFGTWGFPSRSPLVFFAVSRVLYSGGWVVLESTVHLNQDWGLKPQIMPTLQQTVSPWLGPSLENIRSLPCSPLFCIQSAKLTSIKGNLLGSSCSCPDSALRESQGVSGQEDQNPGIWDTSLS